MAIRLYDQTLRFKPGFLPDYRGPVLPGDRQFFCDTDQFHLMVQEFRSDLYTIRLNFFHFIRQTVFHSDARVPGLLSRTMLKGSLTHKIRDTGKLQISEETTGLLWTEETHCEVKFKGDADYQLLDIAFTPELTSQLAVFFPELQTVINSGATKLITSKPCFITPSLSTIIRQIIECPYDASASHLYFDIKVREFLFTLLQDVYFHKPSRYLFNEYETAQLFRARQILLSDIKGRPHTIADLARAVGLNTFKIKAGFRELFGTGVFECLQEKRMEQARALLVSTDKPIKEISALAGYSRVTNFITAFRKKFGYTPGTLREHS